VFLAEKADTLIQLFLNFFFKNKHGYNLRYLQPKQAFVGAPFLQYGALHEFQTKIVP